MEKIFKRCPSVCVVLAGVMWGIISIFVKRLTAEGFSPFDIMLIRSGISGLCIFLYLAIFDREKLKINIRDFWLFIGTGVVSFFCYGVTYCMTIESASASVAAVLLYTSPVFVMLMAAIFFKEKITKMKLAATVVALLGCVLVSGGLGGESISPISLATGLVSGFTYALYSIFGKPATRKYSPITVTMYTFILAGIASAFLADTGGIAGKVATEPSLIIFFIITAAVTALLPYMLYTGGLKYISAGNAAVVACIEPAVAFFTGVTLFGDAMTVQSVTGTAMILGAIVLLNKKSAKKI